MKKKTAWIKKDFLAIAIIILIIALAYLVNP